MTRILVSTLLLPLLAIALHRIHCAQNPRINQDAGSTKAIGDDDESWIQLLVKQNLQSGSNNQAQQPQPQQQQGSNDPSQSQQQQQQPPTNYKFVPYTEQKNGVTRKEYLLSGLSDEYGTNPSPDYVGYDSKYANLPAIHHHTQPKVSKIIPTSSGGQCYCPCNQVITSGALVSPGEDAKMGKYGNKVYFFDDYLKYLSKDKHDGSGVGGGGGGVAKIIQQNKCNFKYTDCNFRNDDYAESRFAYGFNGYFDQVLWYINTAFNYPSAGKLPPIGVNGGGLGPKYYGWGRLISPYFYNTYHSVDGCLVFEFEFNSEGMDRLSISIQDSITTRPVIEYTHERPNNVERSTLKKHVPFKLVGNARFFVQVQYETNMDTNQYGLKMFEVHFTRCTSVSTK